MSSRNKKHSAPKRPKKERTNPKKCQSIDALESDLRSRAQDLFKQPVLRMDYVLRELPASYMCFLRKRHTYYTRMHPAFASILNVLFAQLTELRLHRTRLPTRAVVRNALLKTCSVNGQNS